MFFTFTDFGAEGPYLGQVHGVLASMAPAMPVIHLISNAPRFDPRRSSYLLAALTPFLPEKAIVLAIVDPGVGGEREGVCLCADGRFFIGPDNGLLDGVAQNAQHSEWRIIDWRPQKMSSTFHGRDLFAPTAARIAQSDFDGCPRHWSGPEIKKRPLDLYEVIYEDAYGNAMTGIRFQAFMAGQSILWEGDWVNQARTFSDVPAGAVFWYENSLGLIEIARNGGALRTGSTPCIGQSIRFSGH